MAKAKGKWKSEPNEEEKKITKDLNKHYYRIEGYLETPYEQLSMKKHKELE